MDIQKYEIALGTKNAGCSDTWHILDDEGIGRFPPEAVQTSKGVWKKPEQLGIIIQVKGDINTKTRFAIGGVIIDAFGPIVEHVSYQFKDGSTTVTAVRSYNPLHGATSEVEQARRSKQGIIERLRDIPAFFDR
ncbi:MAG: hypothetical protein HY053_08845 [Proteobacteria bacterium]|nr:hypothetical protein [Pseudomonadota bacterium]